jgi:hypothetical protein
MFRNRAGSYAIMLGLAASLVGMFFFLTLFVQEVLGYSPLKAGLAFLPVSEVIIVTSQLVARLLPVVGPKRFMVAGALLTTGGLAWLSRITVSSGYLDGLLGPMLVFGLGMGCLFVPLTLTALSGVSRQESGAASSLLNAMQQMGGSLGLSILVTVFGTASRKRGHQPGRQVPGHRLAGRAGTVPADRAALGPDLRPDPGPRHLRRVRVRGPVRAARPGHQPGGDPSPAGRAAAGRRHTGAERDRGLIRETPPSARHDWSREAVRGLHGEQAHRDRRRLPRPRRAAGAQERSPVSRMRLGHAWATRGRRSGGTELQPGSVGQAGDPLGPKPRRQRLQQVGHPPGRNDGDTLGPHQAPGDAGAVDSDDRGDLEVGDAEDLVSLVGLPHHLAQGRDQQVAAMPDPAIVVQP